MKNVVLFFITAICLIWSCEKQTFTSSDCDEPVVISEDQFKNAPSDNMLISKVEMHGNCLRIRFGAGGCDGKSWKIKLVASEMEYFSMPPQRDVRLSLEDNEDCEAFITREMTFDVTELRSSGHAVQLNIVNADTSVLYKY